jgi:hypothetical protein
MALRRSLMGMAKVGDGGPRVDQTLSERSTPARRTNLTAALNSSSLLCRHPLGVYLSTIPVACTERRLQATRLRCTRAPICQRARPRIRYRWIGAIGVCRTCSRRTLGPLVTSCSGTGFIRMKDPAPAVNSMSCSANLGAWINFIELFNEMEYRRASLCCVTSLLTVTDFRIRQVNR